MFDTLFDAAKTAENPDESTVPEPFQSRSGMYQTVPDRSEPVPEAKMERKWYTKRAENAVFRRWVREKLVVFFALAVVVVLSLYIGADHRATVCASVVFTAYTVAADPLGLLERKMSRVSRWMLALSAPSILLAICVTNTKTVIVSVLITTIISAVALIGNRHWRAAESYEMSRHVLKALQPDDNTNHRDACLTAWQADGAREVVAAAAEMGAYSCTEIEWSVRKAAYTIGFCRASELTKKWMAERTQEQKHLARLEEENIEVHDHLQAAADYIRQYDDYTSRLQAAEDAAKKGAKAESELADTKAEIRKLAAEVERLTEANDELVKTAASPLLAEEIAEEMTEKRLKEALELGLSVRQTETYAGVSHRRAAEYLKENRKKKEE